MSTPIGRVGLKRLAHDDMKAVTFAASASATKVIGLDASRSHDILVSVAGDTDLTLLVTRDDPQAVANGTAVYGPAKAYAKITASGYGGALARGVTAVKVTCAKNGAGTDDAGTVTALGGRAQIRFAAKDGDSANVDTGTYGDYTALT